MITNALGLVMIICRWIAGLSNVENSFVWASAIRYVFNASLKDKLVIIIILYILGILSFIFVCIAAFGD